MISSCRGAAALLGAVSIWTYAYCLFVRIPFHDSKGSAQWNVGAQEVCVCVCLSYEPWFWYLGIYTSSLFCRKKQVPYAAVYVCGDNAQIAHPYGGCTGLVQFRRAPTVYVFELLFTASKYMGQARQRSSLVRYVHRIYALGTSRDFHASFRIVGFQHNSNQQSVSFLGYHRDVMDFIWKSLIARNRRTAWSSQENRIDTIVSAKYSSSCKLPIWTIMFSWLNIVMGTGAVQGFF